MLLSRFHGDLGIAVVCRGNYSMRVFVCVYILMCVCMDGGRCACSATDGNMPTDRPDCGAGVSMAAKKKKNVILGPAGDERVELGVLMRSASSDCGNVIVVPVLAFACW